MPRNTTRRLTLGQAEMDLTFGSSSSISVDSDTPDPTYSADLVGPALDTVFGTGDGNSGPAVHAFCR